MYYDILQRLMRELDSLQQKLSSTYLDSQIASTDYGKTIDTYFDITTLEMRNNVIKLDNIKDIDNINTDINNLQSSVATLNDDISELQNNINTNKLFPVYMENPSFGETNFPHLISIIQTPNDCDDLSNEYFDTTTLISSTGLPDFSIKQITDTSKHLYDYINPVIYNGTLPMTEEVKSIYLWFEYRFFHYEESNTPADYPDSADLNIQFSFYNTYRVPVFNNTGNYKFNKDESNVYVPTIENSNGLDSLHSYYKGENITKTLVNASYIFNFNNYNTTVKTKLFGSNSNELSSFAYPFTGEAGMCLVKVPVNGLMQMNDILGGKSLSSSFLSPFLLNFNIRMWLDTDTYFNDTADTNSPANGEVPMFFKYQDTVNGLNLLDVVGIRQVAVFYSNYELSNSNSVEFYKPGLKKYIYNLDYSSSSSVPTPPTPPASVTYN